MTGEKPKPALFSWIDTREDALRIVRDGSIVFFIVAALQGGIGIFTDPSMLLDALIFGILGGVLLKWRSRVAAMLLLLLAGMSFAVTILNRMGIMAEGGRNIILAAIVLWVAIRVVEAAFKLRGRFSKADREGKGGQEPTGGEQDRQEPTVRQ